MKVSDLIRTAAHYDQSIVGIPPGELESYDDEEKKEAFSDLINRAIDILTEAPKAFEGSLNSSEANSLKQIISQLKRITRK